MKNNIRFQSFRWTLMSVMSLVLVMMCSCSLFEQKDPLQQEMEAYALKNLHGDPSTYEFDVMGPEMSYRYKIDLDQYIKGLKEQSHKNPEAFQAEIDKAEKLKEKYGVDVACYERCMHFWASSNGMKLPQMVFAIYDTEGKILYISTSRDDLPTYPALHILRDRGEL